MADSATGKPPDCCPGETLRGDPHGMHTHDCPVYLANCAAWARQWQATERKATAELLQAAAPTRTSERRPGDDEIALAWHDVTCPEAQDCRDRRPHSQRLSMVTSGVVHRFVSRIMRGGSDG